MTKNKSYPAHFITANYTKLTETAKKVLKTETLLFIHTKKVYSDDDDDVYFSNLKTFCFPQVCAKKYCVPGDKKRESSSAAIKQQSTNKVPQVWKKVNVWNF